MGKVTSDKADRKKTTPGQEQQEKIKMFSRIKVTIANVRGINAFGKRQQLAKQWEEDKVDIAMLSETQKTLGEWNKACNGSTTPAFLALASAQNRGKRQKRKGKRKARQLGKITGKRKTRWIRSQRQKQKKTTTNP